MKEKYGTSKYIDTSMSLAHDDIFTQISAKTESNSLENKQLRIFSKSTRN